MHILANGIWSDGTCDTKITINEKAPRVESDKSPATGSGLDMAMVSSAIILIALSMSVLSIAKTKKKTNK